MTEFLIIDDLVVKIASNKQENDSFRRISFCAVATTERENCIYNVEATV